MVAKIIKGKNFAGLVNYTTQEWKGARVLASEGICTTTPENIISSFSFQARMNPRLEKFVGHIAFGWSPEDDDSLTEDIMVSAVKEYMKRMGIQNTQYMIVRHFDADHPHVHLVFNRVDNSGKTIPMNNDYDRSTEICKAINLEYGFTGWQWDKKKDKNLDKLRNREWARENLRQKVFSTLPCSSWQSFQLELAKVGVSMSFRRSKDGKRIVGIVFSTDKFSCGGSKLDPQLAVAALDRMFRHTIASNHALLSEHDMHSSRIESKASDRLPHSMPHDYSHTQSSDMPNGLSSHWIEDIVESGEDGFANALDVASELILMPHVATTTSVGGGGASNDDWDDKKKDKRDNNQICITPKKRR